MSKPNILVVCDKESFSLSIRKLLQSHTDCSVELSSTAMDARDRARENVFDVIFVNTPLGGDMNDDFIRTLVKLCYSSVIILAPMEIRDKLSDKYWDRGIMVLGKPLRKAEFLSAFDAGMLAARRTRALYNDNIKLRKKIRELKTIDRAKVLLVEYLKLSEEQAHKYLEQQAMELRKSKFEVAQSIINTYEF